MDKVILSQGDKIDIDLDGDEFTVEAWTDDLEITPNSLMVINNTMCCTGDIRKIKDNHYKVKCFYQDALIVQDEYYYGKQSELD